MCGRPRSTIVSAMTETLHETPPAGPPPAGPLPGVRLVRDPDDKLVAGVCAGLARSTRTDPVLWRVLVVVLALFGGAGVVLYGLAWLLTPRAGAPESLVERVVRGGAAVPTATAVVVGLLGVVALAAVSGDGTVPLALLVFGALAVLSVRERRAAPPPTEPWPVPEPVPAAAVVAVAPRERSPLGLLTLSAAVLVVGLLLLARAAGLDGVTPPRVLAAALLVVGTGLVVGTWYGRARWLLLPGVLLLGAVLVTSAAEGPYGWSTGTRTWTPATDLREEYRLGAGEATLDLRGLEPGELSRVRVAMGAGHLVVLLPDALPARLRTDVDAGEVVQLRPDGTRSRTVEDTTDAAGRPTVLDLSLRVGQIEVRRVAA